jgi:hypothetical protein
MAITFTVRPKGGGTKLEGITIPTPKTVAAALKAAPRLGSTEADLIAHAMNDLVVPAQAYLRTRKTWPKDAKAAQAIVDEWLKATPPVSRAEQIAAIKASDDSPEVKLAKLLAIVEG